jgi:Raf kinase inhibitor-like YbhB/YbcL family protein
VTSQATRRAFAGLLAVTLAGCLGGPDADDGNGGDSDETEDGNPVLEPATGESELRITSPAFDDGESIPRTYGYAEANVNPPLEIANVPNDAASLVLAVDDPDAVEPAGEIWVHWLVWNIPPETTTIPEDWTPESAVEGTNDFGEIGYGGPNPPDGEHTYRFKCYALETSLDLDEGATVDELGETMDDDIVARAQLEGWYAP